MKVPTFLRPIQVTPSFRAQVLPGKWRSVVPWWYARGAPPQDRLRRIQNYYPFPVAWFLRARHWLWDRTGQAVLLWLYDVAIIDWPVELIVEFSESDDIVGVRGIIRLLRSFTLRGYTIYKRQLDRAHVDSWRDRGYREGYAAGRKSVLSKLNDKLALAMDGPGGGRRSTTE